MTNNYYQKYIEELRKEPREKSQNLSDEKKQKTKKGSERY